MPSLPNLTQPVSAWASWLGLGYAFPSSRVSSLFGAVLGGGAS